MAISHAGHNHESTPKARAACRKFEKEHGPYSGCTDRTIVLTDDSTEADRQAAFDAIMALAPARYK